MDSFKILSEISKNNGDIILAPLSNVEEVSERKKGWGYVKIAVPNEVAHKLLNDTYNIGGLILTTKNEYKKYSKEMNNNA